MKKCNEKGFTLIELLAAITILGIITALSMPLIRGAQESNERRKFTTYSDSLEKSAKLYVDSYSEDLFGHRDGGCAYITWEQLYEKNLTKDIQIADMSCNSRNSFVKVVKYKDHYSYYTSLGCGKKKNGAVDNVTITLPDSGRAQEIDEGSCGGPDTSSITIKATPSKYTKNDRQTIGINIKITSQTGINYQKSISYAWSDTKAYNSSLDWKQLDIAIPSKEDQEKRIVSGNSITATSKQLVTPANQTGDYYLIVKVDALSDLFGTVWNMGDPANKNYVIFGKYRIDNTKPDINTLNATSSESTFNSVTPKITLDATDVLASTDELKMCYSYDENSCGRTKSDFNSSKYIKYTTSKTLSKIKDELDGTSHTIYVTVVDPAGNYRTKTVDYKISLKHNITYDLDRGGTKGASAPTTAYADRETTISNPTKKVTASFDANGQGATISSTADITESYTFKGWTGENISPNALRGITSATVRWKGGPTTNIKFKALTKTYNATVKMIANWQAPTITLPTITKAGKVCIWNSTAACNGDLKWDSGGEYTPSYATKRTFYACCKPLTCTLSLSGDKGENGWYTGDVKVTMKINGTASDYGLATTKKSKNAKKSVTHKTDGQSITYYGYVENNGVSDTCSKTFKRDTTPPILTISNLRPETGSGFKTCLTSSTCKNLTTTTTSGKTCTAEWKTSSKFYFTWDYTCKDEGSGCTKSMKSKWVHNGDPNHQCPNWTDECGYTINEKATAIDEYEKISDNAGNESKVIHIHHSIKWKGEIPKCEN